VDSRERVIKVLNGEKPDRVPFLELLVDTGFSDKVLHSEKSGSHSTQNRFTDLPILTVPCQGGNLKETRTLIETLKLDAIGISFWIKHLGVGGEIDGRQIFSGSTINTIDDVKSIRFPDPHDVRLYEPLKIFLEEMRDTGKALYCVSNLGSDPVILGLGFENFCMDIYTKREVVTEMLNRYSEWQAEVFKVLSKMDFDFFWTTDDIAFKTSTYISPDDIRDLLMPGYKKVAAHISKPWIYHSDGDLNAILDDLLDLGMNAIHPIEPGPMNLAELYRKYSNKISFVGHIDINDLSEGAPEQIEALVIQSLEACDGGCRYLCGSSNSITNYCKPENVMAMQETIFRYGDFGKKGNKN